MALASGVVEPPVNAADLAEAAEVPHNYMAKILHQLVRARILQSVRGKHGGFDLAVPADELSLLRVVSQFDDLGMEGECLFGRAQCGGSEPCAAHGKWKKVAKPVFEFFSKTMIADVV